MKRLRTAPASLVIALLFLSACGASVVAEEDLEQGVSDQLTETVGQKPDKIDCPGDLEAEVGKTMRCTLTAGPDELGVTLKITKVDGSDVEYDIEVDES